MKKEFIVPGFKANGIACGIKKNGTEDLALLYSVVPSVVAGVFTKNSFKAAPVVLDMMRIKNNLCQAIVINSGNANAATGEEGLHDAYTITKEVATALGIEESLVLVASTGVIGERLPIEKIKGSIGRLISGLTEKGIKKAAKAIMTTDKFPKIAFCQERIGGNEITLCGIAKGAGMICPDMATMLAFFMTDVQIEQEVLHRLFHQVVNDSFNAISVDGCMSTNDMAIIVANGVAKNKTLTKGDKRMRIFKEMLLYCAKQLAEFIVRDGEGATKIIEVTVSGAEKLGEAKKIAMAIANSNLVKTAVFGGDPNWGRIISAVGSSGVKIETKKVKLYIEDMLVFAEDKRKDVEPKRLHDVMSQEKIKIFVDLGKGKKVFSVLASDLTYDYIKINAHYHT